MIYISYISLIYFTIVIKYEVKTLKIVRIESEISNNAIKAKLHNEIHLLLKNSFKIYD